MDLSVSAVAFVLQPSFPFFSFFLLAAADVPRVLLATHSNVQI